MSSLYVLAEKDFSVALVSYSSMHIVPLSQPAPPHSPLPPISHVNFVS